MCLVVTCCVYYSTYKSGEILYNLSRSNQLCTLTTAHQQYGQPPGQTSVTQRTQRPGGGHAPLRRARMPPVRGGFGMPPSVDSGRENNETPRTASAQERRGCPGVESSRDPRYTPVQALPSLIRTVPKPPGCELQMRWK